MVLAGAGGIDHADLCKLAKQHFGKITDKYEAEIPLDLHVSYNSNRIKLSILSKSLFLF